MAEATGGGYLGYHRLQVRRLLAVIGRFHLVDDELPAFLHDESRSVGQAAQLGAREPEILLRVERVPGDNGPRAVDKTVVGQPEPWRLDAGLVFECPRHPVFQTADEFKILRGLGAVVREKEFGPAVVEEVVEHCRARKHGVDRADSLAGEEAHATEFPGPVQKVGVAASAACAENRVELIHHVKERPDLVDRPPPCGIGNELIPLQEPLWRM